MSLPKFPDRDNAPTREEVVNQIISSIAMGELGLSHIINAEGEKLQYALGTIPGIDGPKEPLTMEELLKLNDSVHKTLDGAMMNQFFMKEKLLGALSASVMQGPAGPVGTILGSYETIEDLEKEHPQGKQGDAYLVGGQLYVWDEENKEWKSAGDLTGPQGPQGEPGTGTTIKGSYETKDEFERNPPPGSPNDAYLVAGEIYIWNEDDDWHSGGGLKGDKGDKGDVGVILDSFDTLQDLIDEHEEGNQGDAYLVGGVLYVWDAENGVWKPIGSLKGEKGDKGDVGVILDSFDTLQDLIDEHEEGNQGDAYLVGGELYTWDAEEGRWKPVGSLQGPTGPAWEPDQPLFSVAGDSGEPEDVGYEGTLSFESDTLDITVEPGPVVKIESSGLGYNGALVPFSSGAVQTANTTLGSGLSNDVVVIAFGNGIVVSTLGGNINLTGTVRPAFPLASDGVITEMSAYLTATSGGLLGQTCVVSAQLFQSLSSNSDTFEPIPDAKLSLAPITGEAAGQMRYGVLSDMNVAVTAGRRLLMAFLVESEYTSFIMAVTGYFNASIKMK